MNSKTLFTNKISLAGEASYGVVVCGGDRWGSLRRGLVDNT